MANTRSKKLALLCAVAFVAGATAFGQTTRSAAFYLNAPDKYLDRPISLPVAHVDRRDKSDVAGKVFFYAYTVGRDNSDSEYIVVAVPESKADAFARRYGTFSKYNSNYSAVTRLVRGILRKVPDQETYFLEVQGE